MGICGGKSASETYRRGDDQDAQAVKIDQDKVNATCSTSVAAGAEVETTRLANLRVETAQRRVRLIKDNLGDITDWYNLDAAKLGQGAFGCVSIGTSKETGATRAIKSLSKARAKDTRKRYRQEIWIMKMTDHPNIIKLYETFEDKQNVFLVMELCVGGDLWQLLSKKGRFREREAAVLMHQIFRPVTYMHEKRICHRDIKPENFLFLKNCNDVPLGQNALKIIDFGFSCAIPDGQMMSTKLGTPVYSSPQVFAGQYDHSCDVWSCGVMLYFFLSGQPPFTGRTDAEVLQNVKRGNYAFKGALWDSITDVAKDMIRKLLKYQPQDRYNAQQALTHSYILDSTRKEETDLAGRLTPSLLMDLRSFCSQNMLRRAALQVIASQLGQEETETLRRAFEALDRRGAGVLTVAELKARMEHQLDELRLEFNQVVDDLSRPKEGAEGSPEELEIGFTEFLAATLEAKHFQKDGTCQAAFRVFDRNGDGRITVTELENVLVGPPEDDSNTEDATGYNEIQQTNSIKKQQEKMREQQASQVKALLKEADVNGDGVLDFQEFKFMLLGDRISAV